METYRSIKDISLTGSKSMTAGKVHPRDPGDIVQAKVFNDRLFTSEEMHDLTFVYDQ